MRLAGWNLFSAIATRDGFGVEFHIEYEEKTCRFGWDEFQIFNLLK